MHGDTITAVNRTHYSKLLTIIPLHVNIIVVQKAQVASRYSADS